MRSRWKGIYQPAKLIKYFINKTINKVQVYSRALSITANLVGKPLLIYNGRAFTDLKPSPLHVGYRVGEFART
jgi:ribosomal protein S19